MDWHFVYDELMNILHKKTSFANNSKPKKKPSHFMFFFFGLRPHLLPPFFPTFWTSKLEHYINLCLIKLIIILLINENITINIWLQIKETIYMTNFPIRLIIYLYSYGHYQISRFYIMRNNSIFLARYSYLWKYLKVWIQS